MGSSYFEVVNVATGEVVGDLPSPMLIEAGGGEAFQPDNMGDRFWRLREPKDPPGTVYTRVKVRHLEDWWVEFDVTVKHDSGQDAYRDWFPVRAVDGADAIARAVKVAEDDFRSRWGDEDVLMLSNAWPHKGFRI